MWLHFLLFLPVKGLTELLKKFQRRPEEVVRRVMDPLEGSSQDFEDQVSEEELGRDHSIWAEESEDEDLGSEKEEEEEEEGSEEDGGGDYSTSCSKFKVKVCG